MATQLQRAQAYGAALAECRRKAQYPTHNTGNVTVLPSDDRPSSRRSKATNKTRMEGDLRVEVLQERPQNIAKDEPRGTKTTCPGSRASSALRRVYAKPNIISPHEQILAYYANRVNDRTRPLVNATPSGNVLSKPLKKGHNRCNSSGVGVGATKLVQSKRVELERAGVLVPGTTKGSDRARALPGCIRKAVPAETYLAAAKATGDARAGIDSSQPKRLYAAPCQDDPAQVQKKRAETAHAEVVRRDSQKLEEMNVSGKLQGNSDDLVMGKQVGQGAYAKVKVAYHKELEKKMALKIYDKIRLLEPQRQKSVQREIKILQRLSNPNIVKLYDAFDTPSQVILCMEYVKGTSLHGYLKAKTGHRLQEWEAKKLFRQVVSGIEYCHSKCVTHRDIKLENLLLDENNNVKIIDFGFSTCIPNTKKIKIFCGTPSYMAPEIVCRKEYAGPPADVWALGVLLYAMLCGTFPFKGNNDRELYQKISRGCFDVPDYLSTLSKALLLRVLQVDPDKRPTSGEILLDIWLNSSDTATKPLSYRAEHTERSSSRAKRETERGTEFLPPRTNNEVSPGGTVNNNFNIVNNITHITYGRDCPPYDRAYNQGSIDYDIVNSIIRLGYSSGEVAEQLKNEGTHIYLLYNKIKEHREKLNAAIAPQYVPSIGSLSNSRRDSTRSKSKPGTVEREDEKNTFGSARGKRMSDKNVLFNNTSPFVLPEHQEENDVTGEVVT